MKQFIVGEVYECGSFNGNENVFRVTARTENTVDLTAIYEIDGEELESAFGTWNIEVINNVECVLIEQGYFDDGDKEYIMADYPR